MARCPVCGLEWSERCDHDFEPWSPSRGVEKRRRREKGSRKGWSKASGSKRRDKKRERSGKRRKKPREH